MSDGKANEILFGRVDTLPEMDNYQEERDKQRVEAVYESSSYAILELMNKEEFKDTYNILKSDILLMPDELQKVFIDKYLDKMVEIYDYEFTPKRIYGTKSTISDMFRFLEFVEFDNITFLKYVWKYQDDILSVDIRKYIQDHEQDIMDEIGHQANLLTTLTENTSEFLRTYNKEGILEWFINRSERNKYEIYAENLD